MSEKETENVVDLDKKKAEKPKETKKTKSRPKKLSTTNVKNELDKVRDVKRVNLEVNGTEYYYEIDGVSTTTKQADFINNLKAIIAYTTTEEAFETVSEDDIAVFMSSMLIAEIMEIYSTLEVGTMITEKVDFITTITDLGILEDVVANIPQGILDVVTIAEKEISKLTDEIATKANEI